MHHATMTCKNHPNKHWHCKVIAVNADGSYNGCRNIFYDWRDEPECTCSGELLTVVPNDETRAAWIDEHHGQKPSW